MNSLKRNFFYNISYQLLLMALPLLTAPYISRIFSPELLGDYAYSFSIVNYFALFGMLGMSHLGNRSIAGSRKALTERSQAFSDLYCLQLLTALIVIGGYVLYLVSIKAGVKSLASLQLWYLVATAFDISWFYFGMEKFKLTVSRSLMVKLLTVISIFVFVKNENDLGLYTLIMSLGTLVSQLLLWLPLNQFVVFRKPSLFSVKNKVKDNVLLFIPVMAYSIYKILSKIVLKEMQGSYSLGIYENADKVLAIPVGIISALGTIMLPRISYLAGENQIQESQDYFKLSFELVTSIASALCFGIIGISDYFIPIFLGEQYRESVSVVIILCLSLFFTSWSSVIRTQYLIPFKKDTIYISSMVTGAIVNVLANVLLIKRFNYNGAAVATLLAEAVVMLVQAFLVRKEVAIFSLIKANGLFIADGVVMFLVLRFVSRPLTVTLSHLFLLIAVGVMVYLGLFSLTLWLTKNKLYEGVLAAKKQKKIR